MFFSFFVEYSTYLCRYAAGTTSSFGQGWGETVDYEALGT